MNNNIHRKVWHFSVLNLGRGLKINYTESFTLPNGKGGGFRVEITEWRVAVSVLDLVFNFFTSFRDLTDCTSYGAN